MDWINANLRDILLAVTSLVTFASLVTALTPTPKDDIMVSKAKGFLKALYKILDILALNIGRAKEKGND